MRRLAPIVVVALIVGGCGLPDAPGAVGPVLEAQCASIPIEWPVPEPPDANFKPFEGDLDEYVDANARIEFDMDTPTEWSVVEESGSSLLLFGRHTVDPPEGPSYRYARFEKADDGWRASAWGGCHIEVTSPGYGNASFRLDPVKEPDPAASTLEVLATERACASGAAPVDREVVPVVFETEETIDITVLVEPVEGGAECPGNPEFPLTIELDGPVGDRTIRDLGLHPGEVRGWPPEDIDY